jgi:ribosomal protein S6--L-glutamate ligase
MRIVILSRNASLYSTSRLALAARARGHDVLIIDPLELQLVVRSGAPSLMLGGTPLQRADVAIPRIGTSISNYGLTVVRHFELMGVPVLNEARAIARSRDKLRALQLLTANRIQVPVTVCARSPASIKSALQLVGGCPAIVKLQQGSQGIGTMIAETPQAVMSLLETFWAMGQDIILQEYIRESKGRDVRAIVVGGKVVAAMRRTARAGEFRSNLHRGGVAMGLELKPNYRQAAIKATRVTGLAVAGVDIVETRSGPKILEINSSPGLEGIERASAVDVAGAIIDYAERYATRQRDAKRRPAARAAVVTLAGRRRGVL